MIVTELKLKNWMNFRAATVRFRERTFIVGANAAGKSNLIDVFRFLRDVARGAGGGGLAKALSERGGIKAIRCLAARKDPGIEIGVTFSDDVDGPIKWRYVLGLKNEGKGNNRDLVSYEQVWDATGRQILSRPDANDKTDPERLTQTHLEQVNSNREFREIADTLSQVRYLHLVPQLLKYAEQLGGYRLEDDPFGQGFLEQVATSSERVRLSRLRRINEALRACVPQLGDLRFVKDEVTGRPHLEALYEHWRKNAGWQRESKFSDGTLRLLGLMWSLLDGDSLLLLEEPELSLNDAIVEKIPALVRKVQRSTKVRRQIILTTHSEAMLNQQGIDGREVVRLVPSAEGTRIAELTKEEKIALEAGLTPAEVILNKARPNLSENFELF
ncbi:AAA family ATPase [Xanthomonas albilineans]|uniref:AAA family ATPase n=1 Tax=Xanthomonas albilineans TaxID=29447 RepID=UPI0005F31D45|nr:ATP-binding protein [Xanthomonas albilineans]